MPHVFSLQEQIRDLEAMKKAVAVKEAAGETVKLKSQDINIFEKTARNLAGDYSRGHVNVRESLTTTDSIKLIPKIIEGKLREAAEPEYLGTRFFTTVNVEGGANSAVYIVPVVGELTATEVAEGGRYNEDYVEFNTIENRPLEIRVKKIGLKVSITEEAIADSTWDVLGINIRKMGRAMARYKEELIFNNFSAHGHTIFDNAIRNQMPEAGTTGMGADGNYNDTLSVEDFIDIVLALMSNGYAATDIIMHPLVWLVFARNSMIGNGMQWGALGGQNVHQWGQIQGTPGFAGLSADGSGQKYVLTPDQVQGRLPMPVSINFSPWVKFDKVTKKFDMYALDRSEVGVIVSKDPLTTENWSDPERDIRNLKVKERYGVGILNHGKAITVAKNIAVAPSYPQPPTVVVKN